MHLCGMSRCQPSSSEPVAALCCMPLPSALLSCPPPGCRVCGGGSGLPSGVTRAGHNRAAARDSTNGGRSAGGGCCGPAAAASAPTAPASGGCGAADCCLQSRCPRRWQAGSHGRQNKLGWHQCAHLQAMRWLGEEALRPQRKCAASAKGQASRHGTREGASAARSISSVADSVAHLLRCCSWTSCC